MDKELFSLAVQGVRRKRRSSGLVVLVLLVSFGFALMSLSVLGSIQATNASYRQNLYGSWYYALPNGQPQDAEFLSRWAGAKRWGQMQCYGTTRGGVSVGTIDEGLRELGRLELASGAWPSALREVAIEEDVLAEMGLEAVPGQKIDLDIVIRCGGETLVIQRSYTLTGVIRPFTDRWMWSENAVWPLVGAVVTPEEAQVVQEKMAGHAQSRGLVVDPPGFSYFIQPRHDPETEPGPLKNDCNALREYLMETRSGVDTIPMENKAILAPEGGDISPRLYLTMILAVAGVSVLCVYLMQLPGDVHSFVTLRSLGMTRGQLWQLCLTETGLLLLPALVLGVPLGAGLTWMGLRLLAYTDSVPVKVALPWGHLGLLVVLWLAVTAGPHPVVLGGSAHPADRRISAAARGSPTGALAAQWADRGAAVRVWYGDGDAPAGVPDAAAGAGEPYQPVPLPGDEAVRYGPEDPHWLRRADHAPAVRGAVPHPGHCFRPCPPAKGRGPLLCGDAPAHCQPAGGGRPVGFFAAGGGCRRL